VVAATATAVSGSVASKQAQRHQAAAQQQAERQQLANLQEQVSQLQAQEVQAQMTPAGGAEEMIGQLARLGELHQQGILSDDEFAAAKAKLLGM
jgi:multidrug resistance efflux pump